MQTNSNKTFLKEKESLRSKEESLKTLEKSMTAKEKELKTSQNTLGIELAEKKKLLDDIKKEVQIKETKILTLGKE